MINKSKSILLYLILFLANSYSQTAQEYFNKAEMLWGDVNNFEDTDGYAKVIEGYTKAINKDPKFAEAYFRRANAKQCVDDTKGALKDYNIAIRYSPKNVYYLSRRASLYNSQYKYKSAIKDYDAAIKYSGNDIGFYTSDLYFWRGCCKIAIGEKNSGCDDLSRSGEMGNSAAYKAMKDYCK